MWNYQYTTYYDNTEVCLLAFFKILFRVFLVLTVIIAIVLAGLVWGPLGVMIAEPIVRRHGENAVPAIRIGSMYGSIYSGIVLNDVSLTSGDVTLLSAGRLMARPSFSDLWDGVLWLSDLEIKGVRTSTEKLSMLASYYGGEQEETEETSDFSIRPIRVKLRDIVLDTPIHQIEINEGLLTQYGDIALSVDLGELPIVVNGSLNFDPLEAHSFNVAIGSGRASLDGSLTEPFNIRSELHSINLGELLAALPFLSEAGIHGDGEISGYLTVAGAGEHLEAGGFLELRNGYIAGLPLSASTSWNFKDSNFSLTDARMTAMSADITLSVLADLRPIPADNRFFTRGAVTGISMEKLRPVLPPGFNLQGENGMLDFWFSADTDGNTAAKAFVRLPDVRLNGTQAIRGLRANVYLYPDQTMSLNSVGEVLGANISGTGCLLDGNLALTATGVNSALVAALVPALAPASPSGTLDLNIRLARLKDENAAIPFSLVVDATSPTLSLAGVRLSSLAVSAQHENDLFTLDNLTARIGNAPLNLAGTLNLSTSALNFDGSLSGLDARSIPDLPDVTGRGDVAVTVRGTTGSPIVTAAITGSNVTVMNIPLARPILSLTYANDRVTIPETTLQLPGGPLIFSGTVTLPPRSEPVLDVRSTLRNFDLQQLSQIFGVDASGRINSSITLAGPLSSASVSASVTSDAFTVQSTDIRNLDLDVLGTTENIEVRRLRANVNEGTLEGRGNMTFGRGGRFSIDTRVSSLELRGFLAQHGIDAGVGGYLYGDLLLRGSLWRPELALNVTSPLTFRENLVDRLSLSISSPDRGRFDMEASGSMGDLNLALKGRMERDEYGWIYFAETGSIDLNELVTSQAPDMKDQVSGSVSVRVDGSLGGRRGGETSPIYVMVSIPVASFSGMQVENVSVPINVSNGAITVRQGAGTIHEGQISINADVNLPGRNWTMTASLAGMNIGKAVAPFLEQGGISGSAYANVSARGDFGALMMMFANGDFRTSAGYIYDFAALKMIDDDGRVPFQEARGSFFWDGGDLWFNPGTQVNAEPGDYLYRFMAITGSLGLGGRPLRLDFNGNFNVEALNIVLGAMRGAFDLTSGSLTDGGRQIARRAIGRAIGLTERDFQNVSFQLRGSWDALQLLNLRIDRSLEGFIPTRNLDDMPERERRRDSRRLQFNLNIPVGRGGGNGENATEQFKRQLIDNILNWTLDPGVR